MNKFLVSLTVLTISTTLWQQISQTFLPWVTKTPYPLYNNSLFPPPFLTHNHISTLILCFTASEILHISGIMQYLFCDWLILFSIVSSRFIYVVTYNLLVKGLFRFAIAPWFSIGRLTFLGIYPFFLDYVIYWHVIVIVSPSF